VEHMSKELLTLQKDNKLYFGRALKIKNKDAEIVNFTTNDSQNRLLDIIDEHYNKYPHPKTRPTLYIVILKARQQGMSTATEGLFFKGISMGLQNDTPYHKNAMIISYDEDSAKVINEMSDRFYQYLPKDIKPMRRPSRGKGVLLENPTNNQDEFERNPGLQSKFLIETAKNLYAGSSYTLNYVHISELSKWDKPSETMKSLMQSVPGYNGIVIVESTANGSGDYFHKMWNQAEASENSFVPLFLSWMDHKEYQKPFENDKEEINLINTLDDEEKQLIDLHGATHEQLNWRRDTIKNKCQHETMDPVDVFHQEYPTTAEEAFLTSGRPRFDIPTLRNYLKQCIDGQRGYLERKGGKVTFVPDSKGYIEIWEHPQSSKQYGIGGDVAKGLITGDYSAGPVYDENEDMVALWHGHIDPDLFADQLELLGLYYNEAVIVPEENNQGLAVINRLKENYWNIYKRTTYDKTTDTEKEQLGWWTSEKTKALAINNLARLIRTKQLGTKSKKFIQECMTYIIEDNGATNAQKGSHDDIVMASAIILYVMPQYVTPVQDIVAPSTPVQESNDFNWVGKKHISEIEDEQKDDEDDGWLNRWGG
jgi:hypothetical protein